MYWMLDLTFIQNIKIWHSVCSVHLSLRQSKVSGDILIQLAIPKKVFLVLAAGQGFSNPWLVQRPKQVVSTNSTH